MGEQREQRTCTQNDIEGLLLEHAERALGKFLQRKILARGEAVSDVASFPRWLDVTLHGMTRIERHLDFRLPAGGSVLAIAGKP